MKPIGIAMTSDLVLATLEGRKTHTRRVVVPTMTKPKIAPLKMEPWIIDGEQEEDDQGRPCWVGSHPDYPTGDKWFSCPYGALGQALYIKEAVAYVPATAYAASGIAHAVNPSDPSEVAIYKAGWDRSSGGIRWRSGRFMPRWAARLWLEVVEVRVERLQQISEEDARCEGVPPNWSGSLDGWSPEEHGFLGVLDDPNTEDQDGYFRDGRDAFEQLWDSINADRGYTWASNPWVWVVVFRRTAQPAQLAPVVGRKKVPA